jgi:hypothetical protein
MSTGSRCGDSPLKPGEVEQFVEHLLGASQVELQVVEYLAAGVTKILLEICRQDVRVTPCQLQRILEVVRYRIHQTLAIVAILLLCRLSRRRLLSVI